MSNRKDYIKKQLTPQMIYWIVGLFMLFGLFGLTCNIIINPMTRERAEWIASFDQFKKAIRITDHPIRGNIYASDGRPIALAGESYKIHLDFRARALDLIHNDSLRMPKDSVHIKRQAHQRALLEHQMNLAARQLARFYNIDTRADRARWQRALARKVNGEPLIDREITYPEWYKLTREYPFKHYTGNPKTHRDDTTSLFKKTIINEQSHKRYEPIHPFDSLALRTIGDLHKTEQRKGVSKAKFGLELQFDSLLSGKQGYSDRVKVGPSRIKRIIDSVRHGYDLYTSLDMDKQYLLEKTMYEQLTRLKARSGTSVLMEVKTGKILAIVNLNRHANGQYWEDGNYAFSELTDPGSTIKVASMLVALNDGVVQPDEEVDTGNGVWKVYGAQMEDHNHARGGYGVITAAQAIERSSNIGVAKLISRNYGNNPGEFIDKMKGLGFGLDLQSDIPGAARAYIPHPIKNGKRNPDWSGLSLPWISHGYETKIPPIYTLSFFNAIANGGQFMRPYFVTDIKDKEGNLIQHIEPRALIDRIASPEAISKIKAMMRRVVSERQGTGHGMNSDIVSISGKTGTAVINHDTPQEYHVVSFCGFFPSDAPKYSIIVVIRAPGKDFPPSGGRMAGPVVKPIAERLVSMEESRHFDQTQPSRALSRHPLGGRKDKLAALSAKTSLPYTAKTDVEDKDFIFIDRNGQEQRIAPPRAGCVPSLIGLSATDAAAWLSRLGYKATFTGYGCVTGQSVPAGTALNRGRTVRLQLGQRRPSRS